MSEPVALISVGTSNDQAISSILRIYEKFSIKSFIIAGTSSSALPDSNELGKFADIDIKEVINDLSPSDIAGNVKKLEERLKNSVKLVDLTGGTKALASSFTIFSTKKGIPITYLEGPGVFAFHYPYVPRPLQSFKTYGNIGDKYSQIKCIENLDLEMFDVNYFSYYFNLITTEEDYNLGVYVGDVVERVDLSSDEKALSFTEELLNKLKKVTPQYSPTGFNLESISSLSGLNMYNVKLDKNFIILDTNTFYNVPSEILNLNNSVFLVLDCVQSELSYKCLEESKDEGCFAWHNLKRLKGLVSVSSTQIPGGLPKNYVKEKMNGMSGKNTCDVEIAKYVENIPTIISDYTALITFDKKLSSFIQNKKNVVVPSKGNYKVRGNGYLSLFRALMMLGRYYKIVLRGQRGSITLKTEKDFKVSISYCLK
ncbi:hypothetical protein [Candidatus Acidianus copahuensis]|uniref:hypothetical protein n=1 Tax=Candidatus Acidianus copahuensis TaxID=1160895 RepID=UPI0012379F53|nr:hypothetical protein [Candidatus Acidianus copahuensis]